MKLFARVDEIVLILSTLGIPKSDDNVVRKIVRVLSPDFDVERRSILPRSGILTSTSHMQLAETRKPTGQALCAGGSACGGHGRLGERMRGGARGSTATALVVIVVSRTTAMVAAKAGPSPPAENLSGKCHRCKQPGHQWRDCKARIIPAPA